MVVNVKPNPIASLVRDGRETSGGGRLNLLRAKLPLVPALAFRVTKFLDNVVEVEIIQANLRTYLSGRVLDICKRTHLFPIVPGNSSQWRGRDGCGLELFLTPHTTLMYALIEVVVKQLVEDPNVPGLAS